MTAARFSSGVAPRRNGERTETLLDVEAAHAPRLVRLAGALEALTRDLAEAHRELQRLRRENTMLRRDSGQTPAA
jgi:hypothetical protein